MAVAPLVVGILAGEWFALPGFILMALLAVVSGQALVRWGSPRASAPPPLSMVTAAVAWLLVPLLGAIPLYAAARLGEGLSPSTLAYAAPLNAFFESMSGFTSTGLTVAARASELPHSLQIWRSMMEWVGAIGLVVLSLAAVRPAEDPYALYSAEARSRVLGPDLTTTARRIWAIYLLYTAVAITGFLLADMPPWEALNHGLTGIATGGFSVRDDSFADYSDAIKIVGIVVILLGSLSFRVHSAVLYRHDWWVLFRHRQVRTFALLLAAGVALLLWLARPRDPEPGGIDTVFTWVSAVGTCGLASVRVSEWGVASLLVVTAGMMMGGMAGSTAGGLKVNRVFWILRDVVARIFSGGDGGGAREAAESASGIDAREAGSFRWLLLLAALWSLSLALGTGALLALTDADLHLALFEAASALNGVGLSVGITGADLPWPGRVTLIVLMWIGRLEILSVLALAAALLGRLPAARGGEVPVVQGA